MNLTCAPAAGAGPRTLQESAEPEQHPEHTAHGSVLTTRTIQHGCNVNLGTTERVMQIREKELRSSSSGFQFKGTLTRSIRVKRDVVLRRPRSVSSGDAGDAIGAPQGQASRLPARAMPRTHTHTHTSPLFQVTAHCLVHVILTYLDSWPQGTNPWTVVEAA